MTPHFFYISDIANSLSFDGKIFRKKSMLEKFRANVLKVPFLVKNTCPPDEFAGPEALVPFHLLLGSTSLPALTYASDRVTSVISQSLVQRIMSAVCLP